MTAAEIHARFLAVWQRALEREQAEAAYIRRVPIRDVPINDSVVPPALRAARHKRAMRGRVKRKMER